MWNVDSKLGMSLVRESYALITAQKCSPTCKSVRRNCHYAFIALCGKITMLFLPLPVQTVYLRDYRSACGSGRELSLQCPSGRVYNVFDYFRVSSQLGSPPHTARCSLPV